MLLRLTCVLATHTSVASALVLAHVGVLQHLQLVSCRNVRNRDLYVLANNDLHLTSLVLGDDTNKPWVTNRLVTCCAGPGCAACTPYTEPCLRYNQVRFYVLHAEMFAKHSNCVLNPVVTMHSEDLTNVPDVLTGCCVLHPARGIESIAKMKSLKFLALHDCNSITNNGITAMAALTSLETLSLRGCRKLTNNGMKTIAVGYSLGASQYESMRCHIPGLVQAGVIFCCLGTVVPATYRCTFADKQVVYLC